MTTQPPEIAYTTRYTKESVRGTVITMGITVKKVMTYHDACSDAIAFSINCMILYYTLVIYNAQTPIH